MAKHQKAPKLTNKKPYQFCTTKLKLNCDKTQKIKQCQKKSSYDKKQSVIKSPFDINNLTP